MTPGQAATPVSTYRAFVADLQGLCEHLTTLITGDRPFVPTIHFNAPRERATQDGYDYALSVTSSFPVHEDWLVSDATKALMVDELIVPHIAVYRAQMVAWTWCAVTEARNVEAPHEAAMVIAIDRERTEVHEARLVRHDDRASLGAWRPWPANENAGIFIEPIQQALR